MLQKLIMKYFNMDKEDAKYVLALTPICAVLFFGLIFLGTTIGFIF